MPTYTPPLRDIRFVLFELLGVDAALQALPAHADLDRDTMEQIIGEAGRFCAEVVFPTNADGDREGCRYEDGSVITPKGFKEAWKQYCEAGWPALSCDPEFGGQGLPDILNQVLYEMLNSSNQAWTMYPGLTHGAYSALLAHGTPEQRTTYLPKLVSGEWTGTMCLTEPHAGTDLGILRTRAEPNGDGSYAITGTKIFISSGEHDLVSNIVHLVLARLPDAPAGTKGISLFVVPKFIPDADGGVGERNGIRCGSIEHKMGIHGNATCVMNLDDARGWLVGEPNKGLNAMFVMMNGARLGVGMQALGLAEIAYQTSASYARERLQGRAATGAQRPDKPADPIIAHADVRRMLMTQRALLEAGRALCYWISLLIDQEHAHPDAEVRRNSGERVALLTPIVKAFLSDNTFEATNLAMQVHGGHGYIWETGVEQYVRDARINMIYEGTNTVQSLDLLGRKVLADGGARLGLLANEITAFIDTHREAAGMDEFIAPLQGLLGETSRLTADIAARSRQDANEMAAAAVPYLRVCGHLVFAYLWARMAQLALAKAEDAFYAAKLATARYYFSRVLPEAQWQAQLARCPADTLMALDAAAF